MMSWHYSIMKMRKNSKTGHVEKKVNINALKKINKLNITILLLITREWEQEK